MLTFVVSRNIGTGMHKMRSLQSTCKKEGKDQESIQSSTTPDTGYLWESDNVTVIHHKREPRGQHRYNQT